jgi:ribosome-binding protein aMBF1 (putative translation factor)
MIHLQGEMRVSDDEDVLIFPQPECCDSNSKVEFEKLFKKNNVGGQVLEVPEIQNNSTMLLSAKRIPLDLSRAIALARNNLGMTQRQLSMRMSIDVATLASIEAGTASASTPVIPRIKKFLGIKREKKTTIVASKCLNVSASQRNATDAGLSQ